MKRFPRSMLAELQALAREMRIHQRQMEHHPIMQAQQHLLAWVKSRPDLLPPVSWHELDSSRQQPAGRPVLMDGDLWFLRMRRSHSTGANWITPKPTQKQISRVQPLDWFPIQGSESELIHACGVANMVQQAAEGVPEALLAVLEATGQEACARFVREHDNGYDLWGPPMVPASFPSPRTLLRQALADPRWGWELGVLEELTEGGEHWEPWPEAVSIPEGEGAVPQSGRQLQ